MSRNSQEEVSLSNSQTGLNQNDLFLNVLQKSCPNLYSYFPFFPGKNTNKQKQSSSFKIGPFNKNEENLILIFFSE